jgi:hypothetical protein
MKRPVITLLIAVMLGTACTPGAVASDDGDTPVNSEIPAIPGPSAYGPVPEDANLSRGQVYLNSTDLLIMESYPLQFSLSLKGDLPTPCNKLRVDVQKPDADGNIAVDVYSVVDPALACAQVLEPFEVNIPLGSFPPGHYKLSANRETVAEFDA